MQNNLGSSLLGLLIATSISSCIMAGLINYIRILVLRYNKQIQRLEVQNSVTLATHYLSNDIHNSGFKYCGKPENNPQAEDMHKAAVSICNTSNTACIKLLPYDIQQRIIRQDIKPNSDILTINAVAENFKILDDGSINCISSTILYYLRRSIVYPNSYALYRDDLVHHSVALVEGLNNFLLSSTKIGSRQAIDVKLLLAKHISKITIVTRNEF